MNTNNIKEFVEKHIRPRAFKIAIIDLVSIYERLDFSGPDDKFKIIFTIPDGGHRVKYIIDKTIEDRRDVEYRTEYLYNDGRRFNGKTVYRTKIDSLADGDDEYIRSHAMFNFLGFCQTEMSIYFCDYYDGVLFLKFRR